MSYIQWFHDEGARDLATSGGKGANLAWLVAEGFRVPPGFIVTTAAYRRSVEVAGTVDGETPSATSEVAQAIRAAYLQLGESETIRDLWPRVDNQSLPVAVRSSATAEDLPDASFAGQQDTFLHIVGADEVVLHVERCWASLWTDRAVHYRREHGIEDVAAAVVVQALVPADTSGVLFTANPVTRRRDQSVVNASYGIGESIVSGSVEPDTFVVATGSGKIVDRRIGTKAKTLESGDAGLAAAKTDDARRQRAALSDAEVRAVVSVGRDIAERTDRPQDIEWSLHQGRVHVLQSRPITTIGPAPDVDADDHWTRAMFIEILPEAPSPAFNSVLAPVLGGMLAFTFESWGFDPPEDRPACAVYYHQPYLNLSYIRAALAPLPDDLREGLVRRLANPFADTRGSSRGSSSAMAGLGLMWRMTRGARKVREDLPGVLDRFRHQVAEADTDAPEDLSDAELAARVDRLAHTVVPPIIAYDFLLIASLGFVHGIIERVVRRTKTARRDHGPSGGELADEEAVVSDLMSGVTGNVTVETNQGIYELARIAAEEPQLAEALLASDPAGLDRAALRRVPSGDAFLAALDRFLELYGHREAHMDIVYPTWSEDPAPVLRFVKGYVRAESVAEPAEREAAAAKRRRAATATILEALESGWSNRLIWRPVFSWATEFNAELGGQRDTMHFEVTRTFPVFRKLLLELGRRWTDRGLLQTPEDIFALAIDETVSNAEGFDARSLARLRRRRWEQERGGPWPIAFVHGEEVYAEEAGVGPSLEELGEAGLRGTPGSPGRATGPVRLVLSPDDFDRVRAGDVVVAPYTNPVWTPLFAIAAAVVTEVGGVLSHGAIVAREYGIPAIVGLPRATARFREGETVTVDGTKGLVTLDEQSQQSRAEHQNSAHNDR